MIGLNCVFNCSNTIYSYIAIDRCVSNCPSNVPYLDDEECVSDCGSKIIDESAFQCVTSCRDSPSHGYLQFVGNRMICTSLCNFVFFDYDDNYCLDSCPSYASFELKFSSMTVCVKDSCGSGNFLDVSSYSCVMTCPSSTYVLQYQLCVPSCPSPYLYHEGNNCVEDCPIFFNEDSYECVSECAEDFFLYENKCVKECPIDTLVIDDILNKACVNDCSEIPGYYLMERENKCVTSCPPDYLFFNNKCLNTCPENTFISIDNTECVVNCDNYLIDISNNHCMLSCVESFTNRIKNNNLCVKQCPNGYIEINNECQWDSNNCPTEQPFKIENSEQCVEECPVLFKENDGICISEIEIMNDNIAMVKYSKEE